MGKYTAKRLLLVIPTLLIVCIIVFVLMRIIPGSAVDFIMYKMSTAGIAVDHATVEATLGMDQPAVKQFFDWLFGVLRGDLGQSLFQSEKVSSIIIRQLPITLELGLMTLLITNLVAVPLGLFCAAYQDSKADKIIRVVSVIMSSLPMFWIATLVLVYPAKWFGYAPAAQYVGFFTDPAANLKMFIVPALLAGFLGGIGQIRTVRTMTLEVMRQDYIRTAWAKGLKERTVLLKHAFRNSLIPIITVIGGSFAGMMGGSVITESMFNIPGIGQQLVNALNNRDYPLVQGCVLVLSVFVLLINVVVDLAYKWADPRVELE